jgi:hypothetical protein
MVQRFLRGHGKRMRNAQTRIETILEIVGVTHRTSERDPVSAWKNPRLAPRVQGSVDRAIGLPPPAEGDEERSKAMMQMQKMAVHRTLDDEVKTLRILRHSVRVILGLSSVRSDEWGTLESHLHDVENAARARSPASRAPVRAAIRKVERFRASLHPNWSQFP